MARIRRRDALAVAAVALGFGALFVAPPFDAVRGLSLDALTALRWQVLGARHAAGTGRVAVLAIDEETYASAPFSGSPTITWTREIGRVLGAVVDGGAAVVGFDVVFPASIEQSEMPFGDGPLGERLRGFDRDYLRALRAAAAQGKLVLGEVQHRDEPVGPTAAQRVAVGQQRNIRSLNVASDADDVVRRLPLGFATAGEPEPSMALELAARALGLAPTLAADGSTRLGTYAVPGSAPHTMTLNFDGGGDTIATYSLADLRACVERGDTDFFRRQFDGKVVLLGTVLDGEDRKATSKRWATGPERARAPRCALPPREAGGQIVRRTVPGVYVHATAVDNLLRRDALREPGRAVTAAIATGLAAAVAVAALLLAPAAAATVAAGLTAGLVAVAVLAFGQALALPLVEPVLAMGFALATTIAYRFVVTDHEERVLRKSFALYLSPRLVERMIDADRPPVLGGETRDVTVFFSDIAGFSSFSEQLSPTALVALMNHYLSAMSDIIEDNGGYIDKYVGDSIVAVFGAPVDDPDHASHAVRAALACEARLEQMNRGDPALAGRRIAHRIGINSGDALVGNIGSRRRFNYTAMSDAVNLASRLEGANKYLGTSILVAEATVARTGAAFAWREIDAIRVKGRAQPVKVFEVEGPAGPPPAQRAERDALYAQGLAAWRARHFDAAAAAFARIAPRDPAAALFEARARALLAQPPGPDWEPVNTLEGK